MTSPARYRRRPVEVEAMQVTEEGLSAILDWINVLKHWDARVVGRGDDPQVWISDPNSRESVADVGDWIVQTDYAFEVLSSREFKATHDPDPTSAAQRST